MTHRAYGIAHQRVRRALLADLVGRLAGVLKPSPHGCLCPRCGRPMRYPLEPLDCGHSSRARKAAGLPGDRLEHSTCNRSADASKTTDPGRGYQPSQKW